MDWVGSKSRVIYRFNYSLIQLLLNDGIILA